MSESWPAVVTVLVDVGTLVAAITGLLVGLILYFRTHRQARYDEEKHRVQLEMMRDSFETKIYQLTDRLVSTEDRWTNLNHLLISKLNTQQQVPSEKQDLSIAAFLKSYGISESEAVIDPNLVFVLTPFNSRFWLPFEAIALACQELNLKCVRGDEQEIRGDLVPHIIRHILRARIIIANVDGRNPNVFYELGMAHALNKTTIIVSKSFRTLPIDLRLKKLVTYDSTEELRLKVQKELARAVLNAPAD
jgi:hypothetical protein